MVTICNEEKTWGEFVERARATGASDELLAEAVRRVDHGESCGQRVCDAGGPPEDHGHLFDLPYECDRERGYQCRCGMDNITFTLLNVAW